jgi:hypothetical protein
MKLQVGQKVRINETFEHGKYDKLIGKIGVYIRKAGGADALYPYRVSFPDLSKEEGYPATSNEGVSYIFMESELDIVNDKELI